MAEEGQVIGVHSVSEWKEHLKKGEETGKLVDVDELESVSKEWEIEAMPTFLFLKEGKLVDKVVGAKKEELHVTIIKHANDAAAGSSI